MASTSEGRIPLIVSEEEYDIGAVCCLYRTGKKEESQKENQRRTIAHPKSVRATAGLVEAADSREFGNSKFVAPLLTQKKTAAGDGI